MGTNPQATGAGRVGNRPLTDLGELPLNLDEIPTAFRALHDAGRFDYWGAPYASLTPHQREERTRSHETQVLWWETIEWDRTPDEVAAFAGDDLLRPGLVPFAGNGYGDFYCWYSPWMEPGATELPVVFFVHDERESHQFAHTFSECLVRCFLQQAALWAREGTDGAADAATLWEAHRAILVPVLDPADGARLDLIGARATAQDYEDADHELAAEQPSRTLVGGQPPTRYDAEAVSDPAILRRLYDQSVAFYRELVAEGHATFQAALDEAVANRREFLG